MAAVLASRLDPETIPVLKETAARATHPRPARALLYASHAAYPNAVLNEKRDWCELRIPPMSLLVFRQRILADFSIEPFEFIAQTRRRKNVPTEEAL